MIQLKRARLLGVVIGVAASMCLSIAPGAAIAAQSGGSVAIADTHADQSAIALFQKLQNNQGKIMFGQQHATDYHASPTVGETSDVHDVTGKYPAVFGFDALSIMGGELPGSLNNTQEQNAVLVADAVKKADAQGAVITMSAHWNNFLTGKNYSDTTRIVDQLLPGQPLNAKLNEALDRIAQVAEESVRSNGTAIPIIFRPLHENNGNWFWWGSTHASASEYIELYRYIVDYLRDVKGVHNLLYAYSPNGSFSSNQAQYLATYPGDDWVDVLGYDYYNGMSPNEYQTYTDSAVQDLAMISRLAQSRGKISAMTEFGLANGNMIDHNGNSPDKTFYTDLLAAIKKNPDASKIAYMLTWADFGMSDTESYVPWKGSELAGDFQQFASDPSVALASGTPLDYSTTQTAASQASSVRFVTPPPQTRIEQNSYPVYVKINGTASASDVWFTVGSDGTRHRLTKSKDGEYWTADWSIDKALLNNAKTTLTVTAQTDQGDLTNQTDVILGSVPVQQPGTVDTFDTYADNAELRAAYAPSNTTSDAISLVRQGNGNALDFAYDFTKHPQYSGISRAYDPVQDWSGYDHLSLQVTSDGSGHKLVIQIKAGDVTFEAYPSLKDKGTQTVNIAPSDFTPASWDTAHQGEKLTQDRLKQVSSFAIYLNDGDSEYGAGATARSRTGNIILDSIAWQKNAVSTPVSVDNFESYATAKKLSSVWSGTNITKLAIVPSEAQGSNAMAVDTGSSTMSSSVVRSLIGQNWSGQEGIRLRVKVQGENPLHTISAALTTYANGTTKIYDYSADLTAKGWETLFIPFSKVTTSTVRARSLTADSAQSAGPTSAELAAVQSLKLSVTPADASGSRDTVVIDDIRADRQTDYPVTTAERDVLQAAIVKAGALDHKEYTAASWKMVAGALQRSRSTLNDEYSLASDLSAQTESLNNAIAQLQGVPQESSGNGAQNNASKASVNTNANAHSAASASTAGKAGSDLAQTGSDVFGVVVLGLALLAGAAAMGAAKRKKVLHR